MFDADFTRDFMRNVNNSHQTTSKVLSTPALTTEKFHFKFYSIWTGGIKGREKIVLRIQKHIFFSLWVEIFHFSISPRKLKMRVKYFISVADSLNFFLRFFFVGFLNSVSTYRYGKQNYSYKFIRRYEYYMYVLSTSLLHKYKLIIPPTR